MKVLPIITALLLLGACASDDESPSTTLRGEVTRPTLPPGAVAPEETTTTIEGEPTRPAYDVPEDGEPTVRIDLGENPDKIFVKCWNHYLIFSTAGDDTATSNIQVFKDSC